MKPLDDVQRLERVGDLAKKLKAARKKVKDAERNLELLREYQKQREDWVVNDSWKPNLILKKGNNRTGAREVKVEIEIPFGVVQQQLVYALQRAKREVANIENEIEQSLKAETHCEALAEEAETEK